MRARSALVVLIASLLAPIARAEPSFDCAKAQSKAETLICFPEMDLEWLDRQMARLFKLAKSQPNADRDRLTGEQRAFLGRRDACGADSECIARVYKERLRNLASRVNVYEAFGEYRRKPVEMEGAQLWIARFGADAAIKIYASGGNNHLCSFEADDAIFTGRGVVKWHSEEKACRMAIVPDGEDMRVEVKGCERYCGARARMDGLYGHAR